MLIDDNLRCVISDFGQSEMKSKAYSISGKQPPRLCCTPFELDLFLMKIHQFSLLDGTLRWQAPELMAGLEQHTTEMDIYAYAMTCVEILSMGRVPWAFADDDAVRHFVLSMPLS